MTLTLNYLGLYDTPVPRIIQDYEFNWCQEWDGGKAIMVAAVGLEHRGGTAVGMRVVAVKVVVVGAL